MNFTIAGYIRKYLEFEYKNRNYTLDPVVQIFDNALGKPSKKIGVYFCKESLPFY